MGNCLFKMAHEECGSSDALQVYASEDGDITGYCWSCDTYVPDPLGDKSKTEIAKLKKKARRSKTDKEIQEEMEFISSLGCMDLKERRLRKDILEYYDIKIGLSEFDGKTPAFAYFPYTWKGEVVKYKVKMLATGKVWSVGRSNQVDLFGWEQALATGAKRIIITEGEFDAAALAKIIDTRTPRQYQDFKPAVVSIPNGAASAARDLGRLLPKIRKYFKEIVLAFDQDEAGQRAVEAVCKKASDITVIDLPAKDANKCLVDGYGKAAYAAATFKISSRKNSKLVWAQDIHEDASQAAEWGYSWPWEHVNKETKGIRLGETIYVGAGQKQGKCFGRDTLVRMYDGSLKVVQDIEVGDVVLGPDSKPRNVLHTHKGSSSLYKVDQKSGLPYVVNDLHDLVLRYNKRGFKEVVIPAEEFYKNVRGRDHYLNRFKGYHSQVEYEETETLPVDPYTFGVWLGDGSRGSPAVCLNLNDSDYIAPRCIGLSFYESSKPGTYGGWIKGFKGFVERLGKVKRIPDDFLINSRRVRMEVLAGLIDTDGYKSDNNSWEIVTKYDSLATSLYYLLRSLGCRVSICQSRKGIKSSGYSCMYNVVKFSGDLRDCPIQVPRKRCEQAPCKNPTNTGISIAYVGRGDYFGFEVDGDHKFLLHDYTVVHNSELVNALTAHFIQEHGWTVLLAKPEESNNKTYKMVAGKLVGKKFHDPEVEFDHKAYDKAGQMMRDKLIMLNIYQHLGYETLRQDIIEAAGFGAKAVFIDPITNLVNGIPTSEQNTKLQEIAQDLSSLAKDLDIVIFIFCHLRNPDSGPPHERGGEVLSSQFAGSRAMARSCNLMFGLEGNRDPNLSREERNTKTLVLLEDREFGSTGRFKLFWDYNTALFHELSV